MAYISSYLDTGHVFVTPAVNTTILLYKASSDSTVDTLNSIVKEVMAS